MLILSRSTKLFLLHTCTLVLACTHDPVTETPEVVQQEPGEAVPEPGEAVVPDRCTSDGDCSPQLAICPHPSMDNLVVCVQPRMLDGSTQPGTCSDEVRCGANSRAECEALAQRCIAEPGQARWDETLPRFRSAGEPPGQCYLRCGRWPE